MIEALLFFIDDQYQLLRTFFQLAGPVLWLIVVIAFLLWSLLIERLCFLYIYYRRQEQRFWAKASPLSADYAAVIAGALQELHPANWRERYRQVMSEQVVAALNQYRPMILTLIALCPLVGLLGTVNGMITLFSELSLSGGNQIKSMADGVFKAILPTMAGMVIALSGLLGSAWVRHRIAVLLDRFDQQIMTLKMNNEKMNGGERLC